jgi:hypothetical protein
MLFFYRKMMLVPENLFDNKLGLSIDRFQDKNYQIDKNCNHLNWLNSDRLYFWFVQVAGYTWR